MNTPSANPKADILVIFALADETRGHWEGIPVTYCGIGKVNAAYRLTQAIYEWRQRQGKPPRLVLNLGSAGSTHFKVGQVINCTKFVQRDFDVTALGFELYATGSETVPPIVIANGARYASYPEGVCGTGDSFVTDREMRQWNVVDMEAYALAKICALENIPFGCIKYITDGADVEAAEAWEPALVNASKVLRQAFDVVAG